MQKGVVLTQEDYYKTYKNKNWVVKTQETALNGNCLFVGSSMSDLFQMSVIDGVRDAYYLHGTVMRSFVSKDWTQKTLRPYTFII